MDAKAEEALFAWLEEDFKRTKAEVPAELQLVTSSRMRLKGWAINVAILVALPLLYVVLVKTINYFLQR